MIFRYKIEIISDIEQKIRKLLVNIAVAPFVGVWVEIYHLISRITGNLSLPSWECGLKLEVYNHLMLEKEGRSLRGSVG